MAGVKLVSMKRSETDKRKDMGECAPIDCIAPDFPWGLVINLGSDEIEKLGIDKLPALGAELTLTAKVMVTRVEESAYQGNDGEAKDSRNLALQITDLGLG